jgi:hypothetical protein
MRPLVHFVALDFRIFAGLMLITRTGKARGADENCDAFPQPGKPSRLSEGERRSHRRRHTKGEFALGARLKIGGGAKQMRNAPTSNAE